MSSSELDLTYWVSHHEEDITDFFVGHKIYVIIGWHIKHACHPSSLRHGLLEYHALGHIKP